MKSPILLFLILFQLLTSVLISQPFFARNVKIYDGYVVTQLNDTLYGKIEMLSPSLNQVKVKFLSTNESEVKWFSSKDLQSYAFQYERYEHDTKSYAKEWVQYAKVTVERPPVPFGPKDILAEIKVEGKIRVYNFYLEVRTDGSLYEHFYLIEKDGITHRVNKDNYKDVLVKLVQDNPILKDKIGRKGYNYNSLTDIALEYNEQNTPKGSVGAFWQSENIILSVEEEWQN